MQPNKHKVKDKLLLQACAQFIALKNSKEKSIAVSKKVHRGWKRTWVVTKQFEHPEDFASYTKALSYVNIVQTSRTRTDWPLEYAPTTIEHSVYKILPKEIQDWFDLSWPNYVEGANFSLYTIKEINYYATLKISKNYERLETPIVSNKQAELARLTKIIQNNGGWEKYSNLKGNKKVPHTKAYHRASVQSNSSHLTESE